MPENQEKDHGSGDTLSPADFPLQSPLSRAAARLLLRSIPHVEVHYVDTAARDSDGTAIGPLLECDPWRAKVQGGGLPELSYERGAEESKEAFKKRVYDDLPVGEPLRVVTMIPRTKSPDQAA